MLFVVSRQQALLAAISEKDANIALLELSASNKKKTQEEVMALKRDRDKLMHQLKQHVSSCSAKLLRYLKPTELQKAARLVNISSALLWNLINTLD